MGTLLLDEDYEKLYERSISIEEDEQNRFVIFKNHPVPEGIYTVDACDVLVVIPRGYNQEGNDMFWTNPRLVRRDARPIPATMDVGGGDSRIHKGREFCRWSRHWRPDSKAAWRPGMDDIISIQRRIEWALRNPDT